MSMLSRPETKTADDRPAQQNFTSFPPPGETRSRTLTSQFKSNEDVVTDENVSPVNQKDLSQTVLNIREYWMPDRLCRTCYECELPFNMFRRRHHCRLCGQVFCHACSSHSIDGRSIMLAGIVRACKTCHYQFHTSNQASQVDLPVPVSKEFGENLPCTTSSTTREAPRFVRKLPARNPRLGKHFKESTTGLVGHDLISLTTLDHMDLQQEFEDDSIDHSLNTLTSLLHPESQIERRSHLASSDSTHGPAARKLVAGPFSTPSMYDAWNGSMVDSLEFNLRRRLLGSSSFVAPNSVLSATSRNLESPTDLLYFTKFLYAKATIKLQQIINGLLMESAGDKPRDRYWGATVLRLAQEACNVVSPNIRAGDSMDIRPYVKVKVIPGGSHLECCYIDGMVFRKDVVHKTMRKAVSSPRILLLSGGIDSQRAHSRLASFGTLMEQEQRYTEIIVEKIIRLRPDLLCVGNSISRQAQECLQEHDVVALQHVKPKLMQRIARTTGATILPSTDHITSISHYRHIVLGTCQHFQITRYPCVSNAPNCQSQLKCTPRREHLSYVHLTGSPKMLGCTLVLRGAAKEELKEIKTAIKFAVFVAYHLRLECSFLKDCGATITSHRRTGNTCASDSLLSSSLAVDFRAKPPASSFASALDHQSLLVTSLCMSEHVQCASAEVKGINYYTLQDVSLGQFLLDSCFNSDLKSFSGDKKCVLDITRIFYHNDGRISVSVVKMDQPLPGNALEQEPTERSCKNHDTIFMWSYCKKCEKIVTPLVRMAEDTWKLSFGKFLEVRFYNDKASSRTGGCHHSIQTEHVFFYGSQNLVTRFEYESIQPYDIYVRHQLPLDSSFHYQQLVLQCEILKCLGADLLQAFYDKHVKLEMITDAIALGCSDIVASSTVSLLATVFSELHQASIEIQCYSSWLQHQLMGKLEWHENNLHLGNLGPLWFPAYLRRELHIRASNWNRRYSLLGQLLGIVQDQVRSTSLGYDASDHAGPGVFCSGSDIVAAELLRLQNFTEPAFVSSSAIAEDIDENDEFPDGAEHREAPMGVSLDANTAGADRCDVTRKALLTIQEDGYPQTSSLGKVENVLQLMDSYESAFGVSDEISTRVSTNLNSLKRRDVVASSLPANFRGYRISGAVARFLGKESQWEDPWIVPLGELEVGRPRLKVGESSGVLLVHEEQPTTIVAYSLSTVEYKRTLAAYLDSNLKIGHLKTASQIKLSATAALLDPHPETFRSWGNGISPPKEKDPSVVCNHPCNPHPALEPVEAINAFLKRPPAILDVNANELEVSDDCHDRYIQVGIEVPALEKQMLCSHKTHIKHRFADMDEKGNTFCKFVCQAYWATQFSAVRQCFCGTHEEEELGYLRSLSMARPWNAQGGKSGATFLKTGDGRFVVKQITRTELQMFLEYAPAYFEYLSKAFFHCYATVLVKVLGVYQIGSHNRVNGKRIMEQVVVMQNLFHECVIHRVFDLKGSTRSRYARVSTAGDVKGARFGIPQTRGKDRQPRINEVEPVLLDENFVEFTEGRPLPLHDQAKSYFNKAVLNDTLFLSLINVVDYSILVGMDEDSHHLVVGIIDYLRQYDIIKKVERVGKSVGMIAGQAEPTVIQPPNYRNRFQAAMEKYFMMVPDKWTSFRLQT